MKNLSLFTICILLLLISCKKKSDNSQKAMNYEEVVATMKITQQISDGSLPLIDNYINSISKGDKKIDAQYVADQIKKIAGVKNAKPNATGSAIVIEQVDGQFTSLLLVRKDDQRLQQPTTFTTVAEVPELPRNRVLANPYKTPSTNPISPSIKKAIILAPFQNDFKQDLDNLEKIMTISGYAVTRPKPEDITLEYYKGDYLKNFGVIYISTHGSANDDYFFEHYFPSSILAAKCNPKEISLASLLEQATIERLPAPNGQIYSSISPQYIQNTLHGSFGKSIVFIDACESAVKSDFSSVFLNNGAAAFYGFNHVIWSDFADNVAHEIFSMLQEGSSTDDIDAGLKSDFGIKSISVQSDLGRNITSLVNISNMRNFYMNYDGGAGNYKGFYLDPTAGTIGSLLNLTATVPNFKNDPNGVQTFNSSNVFWYGGAFPKKQMTGKVVNGLSYDAYLDQATVQGVASKYPILYTLYYDAYDKKTGVYFETGSATFVVLPKK